MAKVKVIFEVDDGYAGGARPHSFQIDSEDYEEMSEDGILDLLYAEARERMMDIISPTITNLSDVLQKLSEVSEPPTPHHNRG